MNYNVQYMNITESAPGGGGRRVHNMNALARRAATGEGGERVHKMNACDGPAGGLQSGPLRERDAWNAWA